jgi:hypothetical protein
MSDLAALLMLWIPCSTTALRQSSGQLGGSEGLVSRQTKKGKPESDRKLLEWLKVFAMLTEAASRFLEIFH